MFIISSSSSSSSVYIYIYIYIIIIYIYIYYYTISKLPAPQDVFSVRRQAERNPGFVVLANVIIYKYILAIFYHPLK